MVKPWRSPYLLGAAAGWLAGMLWWSGLMVAFGPTVIVSQDGEREISVASHLAYAPVVATPWAAVGMVIGAIAAAARGPWVSVSAAVGTVAGGAYSLAASPFDGWLVFTMPIYCFCGSLGGAVVGALTRWLCRV